MFKKNSATQIMDNNHMEEYFQWVVEAFLIMLERRLKTLNI